MSALLSLNIQALGTAPRIVTKIQRSTEPSPYPSISKSLLPLNDSNTTMTSFIPPYIFNEDSGSNISRSTILVLVGVVVSAMIVGIWGGYSIYNFRKRRLLPIIGPGTFVEVSESPRQRPATLDKV